MTGKFKSLSLKDETFVFTGKLSFLVRKEAIKEVLLRSGKCNDYVTKKTTYVVAGLEDFQNFIKGTKSTKLKKAEKYITNGVKLKIINEQEFLELLEM
ncbi:hypothetical protein EKG37_21035 [Robertmurraya yapensis]|uniref:BRCT domain-containing protein n=2 Tax=Bacillaceae TaxID=186817 RepID=A0A3S0KGY5_9BACI|nr:MULTISPECIES: BRCT domain-containing protein [Bacillaceae]RTR26558.1 hypothetical protein EKG37_21035 [Bacillus yapensis]TKC15063.1 hypothetical protein FA727_19400 [Robertmurraya kyonggiensis]TKS93733.1 hypothetical protein FAR12_21040 [Bacillus yapensis]